MDVRGTVQTRAGWRCRRPGRGCRPGPPPGRASLRKLRVPTRRAWSRWPNTSTPPISSSCRQSRSVSPTSWVWIFSSPSDSTHWMPAASPATPRTFGVPPRGSRGTRVGCVSLDESPPVPPSRQAASFDARADVEGPGAGRADTAPCGPGSASRSMCVACRSIGTTPADWAASTRNKHVVLAGDPPDRRDRLDRARARCWRASMATSRVFGVIAFRTRPGRGAASRRPCTRVSVIAGLFHRPQRPADELCSRSVVMTWSPASSDPLIAMFRASVQLSVKTQPLGPLAVEELVEPVPAVVEGPLGRQGHPVPGPARVGQVRCGRSGRGPGRRARAWGNWWRRCRGRWSLPVPGGSRFGPLSAR